MSNLMSLMRPQSVAIIGASNTPGKIGHAVVENMKSSGFKGEIIPLTPKTRSLRDQHTLRSWMSSNPIDVAVLCVPAKVSFQWRKNGKAEKYMIVITAGFKDGKEGELEENS